MRFASYLVGEHPSQEVIERYCQAVELLYPACDDADPFITFSARHPWALGLFDAALPFIAPHAPLRRRLVLMFAILESHPANVQRFTPFAHAPRDVANVAGGLIRAAANSALGLLLVQLVTRCS